MSEEEGQGQVDQDEAQPSGPVTKDEVRAAWEAGATNAAKIRAAIGRGSYSTIQRHLDALRADARAAVAAADGDDPEAPKAPDDLVQALWSSAWAHAQMRLRVTITEAVSKAQTLEVRLADALTDAQAAIARVDELETELEAEREHGQALATSLTSDLEAARAATAETEARLTAEHAIFRDEAWKASHAQSAALGEAKAAHERDLERAAAARDLLEQRHAMELEVLRNEMRTEIRHLVQQVTDLRTALAQREQPVKPIAEEPPAA